MDGKSRRQYDRELQRNHENMRISKAPALIRKRSSAFHEIDSFASAIDEFLEGALPGFFPDFFEKGRGKGKDLFLEIVLTTREANEGGLFPMEITVIEP